MYKFIEPEIAGELGSETIMNTDYHPPVIEKLHYEIKDWLGDDLIASFPCYIVTERLLNEIVSKNLTGIIFDELKVTIAAQFSFLYHHKKLPDFYWMKIVGAPGKDDFGIAGDLRLVISDSAFIVISKLNIKNALIEYAYL